MSSALHSFLPFRLDLKQLLEAVLSSNKAAYLVTSMYLCSDLPPTVLSQAEDSSVHTITFILGTSIL